MSDKNENEKQGATPKALARANGSAAALRLEVARRMARCPHEPVSGIGAGRAFVSSAGSETGTECRCWKDYREWLEENGKTYGDDWINTYYGHNKTCLLTEGHGGPHEWSNDFDIKIKFLPSPNEKLSRRAKL